jgi:hypothetical protein
LKRPFPSDITPVIYEKLHWSKAKLKGRGRARPSRRNYFDGDIFQPAAKGDGSGFSVVTGSVV